jgi:RNA polymerase sigma factor (sigma-70 family)
VNNNSGNNLADKHLIDKVLNGNSRAFEAIIKTTEKLVAQIVFKMISNAEDRKDIAQDIYLKAYNKLPGFKFQSKLSTWIAQISYNTCLDYLRKKKLVLTDNLDPAEDIPDMPRKHTSMALGETGTGILQKDLAVILGTEIEKLPPIYKTLITLYHNEELSYEEIEQITGLPSGTVKSYLFRARKTLRVNLLINYKKEDL